MRIKLVKSDKGYIVLFKRFLFQPFWYFTDYTCRKAWPTLLMGNDNYNPHERDALSKAIQYFKGVKFSKYETVAFFKSVQELKDYENTRYN